MHKLPTAASETVQLGSRRNCLAISSMCAPSGIPAVGEVQSPGDREPPWSRRLEELRPEDRLAEPRSTDDSANTEITLKALSDQVQTACAHVAASLADPA